MLQRVATRCELKHELMRMPSRNIVARTWSNVKRLQHHAKGCMKNLTIFKFEPTTPNMSQHVATHRNRVATRTQHDAPNNVAIYRVELSRLFGRGLS